MLVPAHRARGRELVGRVVERRDRVEAEALECARERRAARAAIAERAAEPREHAVDGVRQRVGQVVCPKTSPESFMIFLPYSTK